MPKPRKKIPATTNSQTLLAIKPKTSTEPVADLITEPEASPKPVERPKPVKKLPADIQKPIVQAQETGTEQQQPEKPQEQQDEQERSSSLFQAVGIISGTIRFNEYGKTLITLGDKEYPLYYVPNKNKRKA